MKIKIKTVLLSYLHNKLFVTVAIGMLLAGVSVVTLHAKFVNTKPIQKADSKRSQSGKVEGISIKISHTPTPTIVKKRSYVSPTPTAIPQQNQSSNPQANSSNNNQSAPQNNSSNQPSNNSNNQSANNQSVPTTTPTVVPTVPTTPEPTPTPTPDNRPFEASWEVNWSGNSVTAVVTANKVLKRCLYTLWGGSMSLTGERPVGDNTSCTAGPMSAQGSNKLWVVAESIYGETREFGDKPSSCNNCNVEHVAN
ncbi:hypothetical protein A3B46_03275 [Candidatus Roizmanbacteria bacterium RIFCSPLOWO2_01_FULL_39_19]|nr:MAG: hypothetical protein A3B46_03275 [Candidatus Roizmanbacteria bacterium RIFCSPLOWO2_01_FULL_39_19]